MKVDLSTIFSELYPMKCLVVVLGQVDAYLRRSVQAKLATKDSSFNQPIFLDRCEGNALEGVPHKQKHSV